KEEMLSIPFKEMIHPDDVVEVTERYTHRLNDKNVPHISTFRVVRKDGSFFWIETNAVITLWEEKPAILNILRDISQRLADEEAMVRSEKLASLGQLSAGLAHELRNPLAVISSCSQFCLENMKLEQLVRENFQVIYRNSQRASRLIGELLAFARPGRFEREEVDVNELVSRMLQMAELEAEPFGITFVRRLNDRIPKIVGDKEKLGQLFLNLIQNAIQAVPKKGKIVLESRVLAQGEVLEVSIVDDGSGIPEDYRSRVFDPFFTTKDGGTGLGLSICHTIVEQHQGSINIECGEETGTRVSVRLPVGQQECKGV
ncbi:MAG: PAS domain S-box protein, partial [Proteobacteria bacterium]|nr:PAS domain S-box protein [Pseudomonadota bacterium]